MTECWINNLSIIPKIPQYSEYATSKVINQNGGVVIYVRDIWSATVSEPNLDDGNCLQIDIPHIATILGIYRSPSISNTDCFISSLDSVLSKCKFQHSLFVVGDININIISTGVDKSAFEYLCLLTEHDLKPAITRATRGEACLDHIFVRSSLPIIGLVCASNITDHDLVMSGMSLNKVKQRRPGTKTIKRNVEAITRELKAIDWQDLLGGDDVNVLVQSFTRLITDTINRHSTITIKRRSQNILKPWITPGLIRCMRHRDRLHSLCRFNPENLLSRHIYKRYRNFCNRLLRNLKRQHERKELEDGKHNPKKLWKTIKSICHLTTCKKEPLEILSISVTVTKWLESLTYNDTENLLKTLS
ncbi:hypothetical protein ACJJTC_014464 [Scirpophaga incertulas]